MTPKFRRLLEIILKPTSSEPDIQQSLKAARELVSAHGFDVLFKNANKQRPEIVYRDRVVYKEGKRDINSEARINLVIPPDFLHSILERIWIRAGEMDVLVDILKCDTSNGKTTGHTQLNIRVVGNKENVTKFDSIMNDLMNRINQNTGSQSAEQQSTLKNLNSDSGWFSKLFSKK